MPAMPNDPFNTVLYYYLQALLTSLVEHPTVAVVLAWAVVHSGHFQHHRNGDSSSVLIIFMERSRTVGAEKSKM